MASSRRPGPLGSSNHPVEDINDGTLPRRVSHPPSATGRSVSPAALGSRMKTGLPPGARSTSRIGVLRQGSRGKDVEKLQVLVNTRVVPSPGLKVDGIFGPKTQAAVLQFQNTKGIASDGLVGKNTWFHLMVIPAVKTSAITHDHIRTSFPASAGAAVTISVASMSIREKFYDVLMNRTGPKLKPEMRKLWEQFKTPTNIGITVGILVAWAASHFFLVGEALDIALGVIAVVGAFFTGLALGTAISEIGDFLAVTSTAMSEGELEAGATHLAQAIDIIGVVAFFAVIAKVGQRLRVSAPEGKAAAGVAAEGAAPKSPVEPPKGPGESPKPGVEGAKAAPAGRIRGLPPEGVDPPVEDPAKLETRPASRPSEVQKGGQSLWDEKGGEWRYSPEDKYHNPHWDYNPHSSTNSPWQNVPIGNNPVYK